MDTIELQDIKDFEAKRYQNYIREKNFLVVERVDENTFQVSNPAKNASYEVTKNVTEDGNVYAECTCRDFQNRCIQYSPPGKCKHIWACIDFKNGSINKPEKKKEEENMNKVHSTEDMKKLQSILEKPFPQEHIKYRPGGHGGKQLAYIETANIIGRLNEAFSHCWSFQILDRIIETDEVSVLGKLSIITNGQTVIKENFGGKDRNKGSNLSDDLKAAASDCLKKCATLLGIGLHLYQDTASSGPGSSNTSKPTPQSRMANGKPIPPSTSVPKPPTYPSGGNGRGGNGQQAIDREEIQNYINRW